MVFALLAVLILVAVAWLGVQVPGGQVLFGILIPYAALLTFLSGLIYRVMRWAQAPVPFRIPTTCGQQRSLPWIRYARLDNPFTPGEAAGRVALEVLFFRSLFRNLKAGLREGPKLVYQWEKWLWLGALLFHWSLFTVLLRHLRLVTDPVPALVPLVEGVDGFLRVGVTALYLTDVTLIVGIGYLVLRRALHLQVRYVSLPSDYFLPLLILGVAATGVLMRYFFRVDITAVKELAMGLVTFHPVVPAGVGELFYVHLFLVSTLLACFPFTKLVHMAGIFLSPTRNLANNNRAVRHVNPWDYPVAVHTYEEYVEEFGKHMVQAGIPVGKEGEE